MKRFKKKKVLGNRATKKQLKFLAYHTIPHNISITKKTATKKIREHIEFLEEEWSNIAEIGWDPEFYK